MRIILSQQAGFCDGVHRAYDIVKEIAQDERVKKPIYVLGSLVHNDNVVKKIESLGVKKVDLTGKLEDVIAKIEKRAATLVITAHGMGPEIYRLAKEKGLSIIDTTCPKVIKVQRLARIFFDRSYEIVIIGDREHKEVKGIYEWARCKACFVSDFDDLENLKLNPKKTIAVLAQTTQNHHFVKEVEKFLLRKYSRVEMVDTVCLATQKRQDEARQIAEKSDAMVVIGSSESANSTRLWEIAKKINPRSYFIEGVKNIKKEWFENCHKVGVTAGASAPQWVIKEVVDYLKKM